MTCTQCGHENSPDASYCSSCGASLETVVRCPACGVENPPDARFCAAYSTVKTLVQRSGMPEKEREEFLAVFDADNRDTGVGFAVMGGIFGEAIDRVGERLVGAVVVGVGLPQICLERDLIRDYYDEKESAGFAYAYTYPGMNRVLQAAGRVIRSADDRGLVLFIDRRFGQEAYRDLFPSNWNRPELARDPEDIKRTVARFWKNSPSALPAP